MAQLLWIGCLESDEEFKNKAQKGYDLASAQGSQKNLLYGLEDITGEVFDSINGAILPPYPIYSDHVIPEVRWSHKENAYDISVGYRNDKYINRVYCKNSMIRSAKEWLAERYDEKEELIIMVYSMRSAPMATACYIKKNVKKSSMYLIITDLPQYMDLGQSKVKAMLKKIDWLSIKRMQKKFDGFILYASKMAEYLKIPSNKWMLMEGSYDVKEIKPYNDVKKKKAVMYSGKLEVQYGIPLLLDAFMKIEDPEAELWITGGGNSENYVKKCAEEDKRIKFYGFLPSRDDVLKLQQQASLLVNMRLPSEPASAYCFPSKLFEYMVTGTPVLSFKLEGIPEEYYDKMIIIEKENEYSVSDAIRKGFSMSEKEKYNLGVEARKFILDRKNTLNQCSKINELLSRYMGDTSEDS